jgi:hypothetical protein
LNGAWVQNGPRILGGVTGDGFGASVSICGDTCIVGAPNVDQNGSNSGAAYIYTQVNDAWVQNGPRILGETSGDQFGLSVSISCNTCIIGTQFNKAYIKEGVLYKGDIQIQ